MTEKISTVCPVCGASLLRGAKQYRCAGGHSFDIAAEGYVNLLHKGGGNHGDDRVMIAARHTFLQAGYYAPLADAVACCLAEHTETPCRLLDAGCGEGYYTEYLASALQNSGLLDCCAGVDLSKYAIRTACRRMTGRAENIRWFVASVYRMPFADRSFTAVSSIFSPFAKEEFDRVLIPGGLLLSVIPDRRHLWGMKEILYTTVYENQPHEPSLEGYELIEEQALAFPVHLASREDIAALFAMTPYFYRSPAAGRARLATCERLETEAAFRLLLYRRNF